MARKPSNLYPHQSKAVYWLRERNYRGILADDMGLGKAQNEDSPVLCPEGWRRIGDLHVDDTVIDPDGGHARVLGVFPQGEKQLYRVTFSDGTSTECDLEHLWRVQTALQRSRGEGRHHVRTLAELLSRGLTVTRYRKGIPEEHRRWFVPISAPVQFAQLGQPLPLDPYLLGALLGDGSIRDRSVTLHSVDEEIWKMVSQALPPGVTMARWATTRCPAWGFSGLMPALRQLGLTGKRAWEKHVPAPYLRASIADRLALLQGLMDTDGDATKRGVCTFNTTSTALRDSVVDITRSLGGIATTSTKKAPKYPYKGEERTGREAYRVNVRLPANPFRLARKAKRWKQPILAKSIVAAGPSRIAPSRCIRVSSKRSLYLTDDYIVTHNTRTATVALRMANRWPALILAPASTVGAWQAELNRWGIPSVTWADRRPPPARGALVTSHQSLALRPNLARAPWGALIVDEVHEFRNMKAKRTKALLRCRAPVCMLLSGTPVLNRREDLWPLLRLLDPERFRDLEAVMRIDLDLDEFILRRTKDEVLELPEKVRIDHEVDLGPGRALYEEAMENVEALAAASVRKGRVRTAKRALRRARKHNVPDHVSVPKILDVINQPVDLEAAAKARGAALGHLRRVLGRLKAPAVAAWLLRMGRRQGPFVVFAEHKAPLALIGRAVANRGFRVVMFHGGLTQPKRTELVAAFQGGRIDVLLCTLAGYAGIDLFRARHLAFAERFWVPGWEDQAEDRIHRIGQKRPVQIHRFSAPDTVDDHVEDVLAMKAGIVEGLVTQDTVRQKAGSRAQAKMRQEIARRLVPRSLRVEVTAKEVLAKKPKRRKRRRRR